MGLCLILATVVMVAGLRFVNPPFTGHLGIQWIRARVQGEFYQWPMGEWRVLEVMSSHIIRAVLAGEDQRFFTHHGFDFIEMNRAVKDLFSDGKVRGASTISMQTARTVFLWPSRSLGRKITEAYFTLLIEALWSKERIMEVYLNTVDWGPHVMGIEAASRNYYKRSSASLTRSQSALLAAVLPNPHKWSPVKPNAYVLQRKAKILRDMMKISLPWKTQGRGSIR